MEDLPAEPSEEFRLGLRSGIILCGVLNKIQPTAVPKVVESPCDSALIPDGAALSAYQYFENIRNFLVAVQEQGLPTFEASDLEQGGKSAKVVNCVLALKSYCDWKQTSGNGVWKFGGNVKPTTYSKSFLSKNLEPFANSLSRNLSMNEKSVSGFELDTNKMPGSNSLGMLVRSVLVYKKPEEVSTLVESVLNKVMEEFEHHMKSQNEPRKVLKDMPVSYGAKFHVRSASGDVQVYILDQVRAMESEMLLRIKQQGLDIIPKIIIVTRLLPDATGTTCNQRLEKVYSCEHVNILRVPFRSEKGIVRRWISRFEVWKFLETFTGDVANELVVELEGKLDLITENYSDGNIIASLLAKKFGVTQCTIAHALEKTKYNRKMMISPWGGVLVIDSSKRCVECLVPIYVDM